MWHIFGYLGDIIDIEILDGALSHSIATFGALNMGIGTRYQCSFLLMDLTYPFCSIGSVRVEKCQEFLSQCVTLIGGIIVSSICEESKGLGTSTRIICGRMCKNRENLCNCGNIILHARNRVICPSDKRICCKFATIKGKIIGNISIFAGVSQGFGLPKMGIERMIFQCIELYRITKYLHTFEGIISWYLKQRSFGISIYGTTL